MISFWRQDLRLQNNKTKTTKKSKTEKEILDQYYCKLLWNCEINGTEGWCKVWNLDFLLIIRVDDLLELSLDAFCMDRELTLWCMVL